MIFIDALVINRLSNFCFAVAQSLAVNQGPKRTEPAQDFHAITPTQRDITYYQEQLRNIYHAPPPQPQQNLVQNWSGNQPQQHSESGAQVGRGWVPGGGNSNFRQ